MKGLMWKLLRKHISVGQMVGFGIANLVGLTIVILAVQFYSDVESVFRGEDSFLKKDYIVISKKVTGLWALLGGNVEFDGADIKEIKSQKWTRSVGEFSSSTYDVYASVEMGGRGMSTKLFFESLPTEFIDVKVSDWTFDESNPEIPVIISKDYLALYNFGFASAQGLPKVSEGMISMIPLRFVLTGNGKRESVKGRIVGFSNRLNTILVPEEFMAWSNERYGRGNKGSSRLIVDVNTPGDIEIKNFMDNKGYEIAGDKLDNSKANYFLTIVIMIVVIVGVLISVLSFFVLVLSIYLLLQKNVQKLQDLLMLGFSPQQAAKPYIKMVLLMNGGILLLSIVLMFIGRVSYMPMVSSLGVEGGSVVMSILVGVLIMSVITIGNVIAINKKIGYLWRQND